MPVNKVVYGSNTLIDITDTTASASDVADGKYFYAADGTKTEGTLSSKNIQVYIGYDEVNTTSYTETDVTLTVAKTGTYTISWMGWRSTGSGTSGSRLYKNGTALDSAHTTFTRSYGQLITLTNQSLNAGDVLVVRARARGSSYWMCVGNLIIEEV